MKILMMLHAGLKSYITVDVLQSDRDKSSETSTDHDSLLFMLLKLKMRYRSIFFEDVAHALTYALIANANQKYLHCA